MKHDSFSHKNGEVNDFHILHPTEEVKQSSKKEKGKKKKEKGKQTFFSEEEKQFNESTAGLNLFKMFFS